MATTGNTPTPKARNQRTTTTPKVRWDDSNMRSSYANVVNATSSREEVTIFFGTNQTWNATDDEFTVRLSERIILNPFAAKRLMTLLGSVLKEYESRYGVLDIEPQQRSRTS